MVAAVAWVLRKAGSAAVDDRIDPKLKPFYERLDKHLIDEESELKLIHQTLLQMQARETDSHRRIWQALEKKQDR